MTDLLRGQLQTSLGSAYILERELGGGGMSRVFVAREEALARDVVVKVLAPELAAGVSAERFAREIKLAAALQEPHIVPVLAAGVTLDGLPFYAMPFIAGESLRARLAHGPLPQPEAVAILCDILKALAYAHGRGIIHRDIKPENVLLSSGTAVVTDFGIAKALSASKTAAPGGDAPALTLTQLGTSIGTPAYMAPEQAAGDPATDHRADLYAWGVLAYELLAGRHPFAGKSSPQALMAAHFSETPAQLPKNVPGALAALVTRCLAKAPDDRPPSAAEVLAELTAVATPSTRSRTPALRLVVLGLVAVVLLAGGVFALRERSGAEAEAAGPLRLAVLPFEHQGPAEQAVFADGLTDALTAKLGALPALAVIDRHSAAQYRNTTKPAQQIGSELTVRWLLEGVVRWARDPNGTWRAQVTPTLVDATSGTTRWTGSPQIVTPADPFTAQGEIATDVARALELELRPRDVTSLQRRATSNPEAFAAYGRGRRFEDAGFEGAYGSYALAANEFERAVTLDSNYRDAWAHLAGNTYATATVSGGAPQDVARMRHAMDAALRHSPDVGLVFAIRASERLEFDHDTVGVDALVQEALAHAAGDAFTLGEVGGLLAARGHPDAALSQLRRAAELDPRSVVIRTAVAYAALNIRRWADARRESDALIALDSSGESGWGVRLEVAAVRGDTLAQLADAARALRLVAHPSPWLWAEAAYAGEPFATRFLAMTPRALGVTTFFDSVSVYYDSKADVLLARGDERHARAYYDSIRTALRGRRVAGAVAGRLASFGALAAVMLGDTAGARHDVAGMLESARAVAVRRDLTDVLDPIHMAALYGRLGEPVEAVRWLETGLSAPSRWTARGYAAHPKLRFLSATPAFVRFRAAHPE